VYTHGFAGLLGGLLVGLVADPKMIVYLGTGNAPSVTAAGLFYGHPRQLLIQAGAAGTVIVWDALVTYAILRVIKFCTPLRLSDAELAAGDLAVHGEEAYPVDEPEPEPEPKPEPEPEPGAGAGAGAGAEPGAGAEAAPDLAGATGS
jgi:Amt family ammonium transporter